MAGKIRCNDILYRQGFVEVISGIHSKHINLEVWNVDPDLDISGKTLESGSIPDESVIANAEIELSLRQAKELIFALQSAVAAIENGE